MPSLSESVEVRSKSLFVFLRLDGDIVENVVDTDKFECIRNCSRSLKSPFFKVFSEGFIDSFD
jgi:hypothetical protein